MKKANIVLVEDNLDDEDLILRAFKKNNIANNIVVLRDGQEALDYLFNKDNYTERDMEGKPVLIILDLKLPKVGGMEVLRQIRSNDHTKRFPVVILTSSREEKDVIKGYNLGVNSYIHKPVDFAEFNAVIQQLVRYWLLLNEPSPD